LIGIKIVTVDTTGRRARAVPVTVDTTDREAGSARWP
jgi:hypothetical protein